MTDKDTCKDHSGCTTQIERNREDIDTIFATIDKIRNRPPAWTTVVISLLMFALGWTINEARFSNMVRDEVRQGVSK